MTFLHPLRCALLLTALVATVATADELGDATRLQAAGDAAGALARVDAGLRAQPKDTHLRFLKGVLLADLKRNDDALAEFQRLTEDYPELAEPYNNIAALHAAAGRFEKAREALESALRANPSYATAHENLGDVYATLASQAYARASQLAPGNRSAPVKLALLRDLLKP